MEVNNESLSKLIENKRKKLLDIIASYGFNLSNPVVIKASQELDVYIVTMQKIKMSQKLT